jgi:hypothetical protein
MYIVAIAWLYVVLMMSISEESIVAGLLTFTLYAVLPLGVLAMIGRRRPRASDEAADQHVDQQDGADAKRDQ